MHSKRKKEIAALTLLLIFAAAGCGRESIYSNYRDLDQLELIGTIGADLSDGTVTATVLEGSVKDVPHIMKGEAKTLNDALRTIQGYASVRYAYIAHTKHLVLGEEAADERIMEMLEFVKSSISVKLDTLLYVVKGNTAQELIRATSVKNAGTTQLLDALAVQVKFRSESYVYTCSEVASKLLSENCALVAAIELDEESGNIGNIGEDMPQIKSAGYAIIAQERLLGFTDEEESKGINMLMNKMESDTVEIPDGENGTATFRLSKGSTKLQAVYTDNGIEKIIVNTAIKADAETLEHEKDIMDKSVREYFEQQIEDKEKQRIETAIDHSQKLHQDFMEIGRTLEIKNPVRFSKAVSNWQSEFAYIPIEVNVTAEIERTNDIGK